MNLYAPAILVAAVLPIAATAQTLDLPPRKAGLWEITTSIEKPKGMPALAAQMCLDAATDREMMDYALRLTGGSCKSLTAKRQGQTFVIDADCKFGPTANKTRTVITGDFQSAYTVRTEGTMEGGPGAEKGPQPTLMTQTAKWKGADCTGMRPGDISMFGGIKLNVKQLKSLPLQLR